MPSIRLTVETITPLLMYGADQNQPELRGSSFRGVLRYWLRTVLGSYFKANLGALYELESHYMGNTGRGSGLQIRVSEIEGRELTSRSGLPVLPLRFDKFRAFEPEQHFQIEYMSHPLIRVESIFNPPFFASLLLAHSIGAFGRRARRGGGATRIIRDEPVIDEAVLKFNDFENLEAYQVFKRCCRAVYQEKPTIALRDFVIPYYDYALQWIEKSAQTYTGSNAESTTPQEFTNNIAAYPVLSHGAIFAAKQGTSDYKAALKDIWNLSKDFAHIKTEIPVWDADRSQKDIRLADRWWAWGTAGQAKINKDRYEKIFPKRGHFYSNRDVRRASAIHIRLHREAKKDLYYPIVTILYSKPHFDEKHPGQDTSRDMLIDYGKHLTNNGFERIYGNPKGWS